MRLSTAPLALLALPLLLTATPAVARHPDAATRFDAAAFFTGHTRGTGRLKVAMHPAQAVDVHGYGRVERDGTIVLDQTVDRPGKDPTRRQWRIREVAPGHYTGTLSDAAGPIRGDVIGGRLKLSYAMKGGLHATQWITAADDGRSAHNRMTVSKLGVPLAHLDETIRRTGP